MSSPPSQVFVNLKRFEVPRSMGGLCPIDDPEEWISSVVRESLALDVLREGNLRLVYFVPEGLLPAAIEARSRAVGERGAGLEVGCQGVHWEDIEPGANFGAFTTLLPAKAAVNLGARWAIIGHSEERRAKLQLMTDYDPGIEEEPERKLRALAAVDRAIQREVAKALTAGLNVLLCIGETAEQRGEGSEQLMAARLGTVLEAQLVNALDGAGELLDDLELVVAYEPVWAIGPGKTPPGQEYIAQAASAAKQLSRRALGRELPVAYGGGLKLENAAMLGSIGNIDGGLVALTRFTGEIGFDVEGLRAIMHSYLQARANPTGDP